MSHDNLLARLGDRSARIARAVVPDPFVLAILLALFAFVLGFALRLRAPLQLAGDFAAGMFEPSLLAFGFQMALVLVTGHALAAAPAVQKVLTRLADLPRTGAGAAVLVAAVAMGLGLLNWGLALVGGAFLAREVGRSFARRGIALNYPLIGGAAYLGLMVWHGGLSGSGPLKVATPGAFGDPIDVSQTLFSGMNLVITGGMVLAALAVAYLLGGSGARVHSQTEGTGPLEALADDPVPSSAAVRWLERSVIVTAALVVPIVTALGASVVQRGSGAINLDGVILLFFVLGLALHRGPVAYANAFGAGAAGAAGILLQFPIYFGIMAVMRESGGLRVMAEGLASISSGLAPLTGATQAASITTFLSAAVVNLFVPSGGGQWALQSPIILETAQALSIPRAPLVMAFAYGDQLTNMLQPFWALPLLSITGLKAREIMGYTVVFMLAAVPVIVLGLVLMAAARP